jgi:hypothetical protein
MNRGKTAFPHKGISSHGEECIIRISFDPLNPAPLIAQSKIRSYYPDTV